MLRRQALLAWLRNALDSPSLTEKELSNPKIFMKLAQQMPGMSTIQYSEPDGLVVQWQTNYMNFKAIYQAVEIFYKDQLNSSFPSGLPSINLLLMSKGEQEDSLIIFLELFFIACIECPSKEKFIAHIMGLEEEHMTQLMKLIQQSTLNKAEPRYQQETELHHDKQKIDELYFKIQSLYSQNDALRNQFLLETEQKNKLQVQIQKIEDEKRKMRRELDEKILYWQQKQQQELEEQSSNNFLTQSNEQIIQILKKQLNDQQHKYLGTISKLKQETYDLKDQLQRALEKISELQSQSIAAFSSKIKHENCVNINQHKSITSKLQLKLKTKQQRQTELERQLIRMKFEMEEKDRKIKREEKEIVNVREQIDKLKNKGPMVTRKTAKEVQLLVLKGLRNKLKEKNEINLKEGINKQN